MRKKYQYFFIFLFLGSMLFTVFQYIPILEEDVHATKSLEKKSDNPSDENDGADDDSGDDENDTDEFFNHSSFHCFNLFATSSEFVIYQENYLSLVFSINTPPPKI